MTLALSVRDLRTHIQLVHTTVRAVDGVSFDLEAGQTLGIVGESGCGKSMTGLSILRLLPLGGRIVEGEILLGGRDLVRTSEAEMRQARGKDVSVVFQDPLTSLNPTMTVGNQVGEVVRLHETVTRRDARARALEVLGLVGVPRPQERIDDYPHQLSGGLRQRVMIAMALALEPKLLIADEPTTALDVTVQAQILDLLDDLKRRLGMAVILITHDMGIVANRADEVVVMYAGQIVEGATTKAIFRNTRHPYTGALLASTPRTDAAATTVLPAIPGLPPDLTEELVGCRFAPRCPRATSECLTAEVGLRPAEDRDHQFACIHPLGEDRPAATNPVGPEATSFATATGPDGDRSETVTVPVLEIVDAVKDYPVRGGGRLGDKRRALSAVAGVSLQVQVGETLGIAGESGCGKSTLGRMLVGLEAPSSGEVRLAGTSLATFTRRQRRALGGRLQLMFQDPYSSLDPRMRVGAIVEEPLRAQGVGDRHVRRQRVAEILSEVGLPEDSADRYAHEFSGGQRQRIGLARALVVEPEVVVADEPVSALDVSVQAQVLNLMRGLQKRRGLSLVFISHDLSVLRYVAERVAVMYLGQIVEVGQVEDVYTSPAHPYTAALLASVPDPDVSDDRRPKELAVQGELPSPLDPPSGCRFRTRCPRAQERCATETPALRSFGSAQAAACHFPLIDVTAPS